MQRQKALSDAQLELGGNLGCYGLMFANTGIIPRSATRAPLQNPFDVRGMVPFGSYAEAQKYAAAHPGSYIIAYQFWHGDEDSPGWRAPSPGQLTMGDIPKDERDAFNEGNWLTLLKSASCGKWYWQYMNYGSTTASMKGEPQLVFNAPFTPGKPNAGVPATQTFNSLVFLVYVPPTTPPPAPPVQGPESGDGVGAYWSRAIGNVCQKISNGVGNVRQHLRKHPGPPGPRGAIPPLAY